MENLKVPESDSSWWEHEGHHDIATAECDYCEIEYLQWQLGDVVDGLRYCEVCSKELNKNIKEVVA